MTTALRIIAQDELSQHTSRKNLWLVIHGYVFDVSVFAEDHPGGWEILRQLAMDKEDGNEQFEDIKHTDDARALAQKYLIGRVENGGMKPFPKAGELRPPLLTIKKPDDSGSMIMLAGAVIVAAAVGAFAYSRQKKN